MEVSLKEFTRKHKDYMDKVCTVHRKGTILGTWYPPGTEPIEPIETIEPIDNISLPEEPEEVYIKNPCEMCKGEAEFITWSDNGEHNICNICLERKFPNPKTLAAARRTLQKLS